MKLVREFVTNTIVGGMFVVVPVYLAILLLLKGMQSVGRLVVPFTAMLPDWLPAEGLISLLLVLLVCFIVGVAVRTRTGRVVRERMEVQFFERLPGYGLFRSLTQRLAGDSDENAWQPALVEIEDALVPGFIIEEVDETRLAVFVPSVPTPLAGACTSWPGTRPCPGRPVQRGDQGRLALGIGVEGPRGGDAKPGRELKLRPTPPATT